MNTIRGIKLRWLHETLGDVTYQLTRLQFTSLAPYRWQPAINAFQCEKGFDRSQVDLAVKPQRVIIRGTRQAPEPADDEGRAVRMIAFEIDYGPFERIVELPLPINVDKAKAEQRNGFLWIELPFQK
jgi:hypothetical protein